jgi:hypothetical protein
MPSAKYGGRPLVTFNSRHASTIILRDCDVLLVMPTGMVSGRFCHGHSRLHHAREGPGQLSNVPLVTQYATESGRSCHVHPHLHRNREGVGQLLGVCENSLNIVEKNDPLSPPSL